VALAVRAGSEVLDRFGLQYADRSHVEREQAFIDSAKVVRWNMLRQTVTEDIAPLEVSKSCNAAQGGGGPETPPKPSGLKSRPLWALDSCPLARPRHFPMLKLSGSVSSTLSHFT